MTRADARHPDSAPTRIAAVKSALHASAFHRWLGLEIVRADDGEVILHLSVRPEHVVNGTPSYVHGGIIAAAADLAGDLAFVTRTGTGLPTVDIRIDYLRPAYPDADLRVAARIVRQGRRLGVADIHVHDTVQREIALARALYALP
ncbi:PaaI family thioesterase [Streptomyces sp. 3N207]|uniref:PaaI family thioesterase n=1 Tax=Streptomyces sp. 3N207 TaxID=3457417 RepID=UPI003FD40D2B